MPRGDNKKPWTRTEDQFLRDTYSGGSVLFMANKLRRSKSSIRCRAIRLGLERTEFKKQMDDRRARMVAAYLSGKSMEAAANEVGRSAVMCYYALREAGVSARPVGSANRNRVYKLKTLPISDKAVALRHSKGESLYELAKELGVCEKSVRKAVLRGGGKPRTLKEAMKFTSGKRAVITERDLMRLYVRKRMSSLQIAKQYNTSASVICSWLRRYRIPVRKPIPAPSRTTLERLNKRGLTAKQIGRHYKVSEGVVIRWFGNCRLPLLPILARRGIKPPSPRWLRILSHTKRITCTQIAKQYGVSVRQVILWMDKYGITRPLRGFAGKQYRADDGCWVRSSYERTVKNWLLDNEIAHEYEPRLPFLKRGLLKKNWSKADFLLDGDIYVEIWGAKGKPSYDKKRLWKVRNYARHGLRLVNLLPRHFTDGSWEDVLVMALFG